MFGNFTLPAGTVLNCNGVPFQLVESTQIECSAGCFHAIVQAQQGAKNPREIYRPNTAQAATHAVAAQGA